MAIPAAETIKNDQLNTDEIIEIINPITMQTIAQRDNLSPKAVSERVQKAREAQKAWAETPVKERARIIQRWKALMWENQEELVRLIRESTGKVRAGALIEVWVTDSLSQYYIHNAAKILKPRKRKALFPVVQHVQTIYKPYGVVGVISPWNYPLLLTLLDAIPALFAGNAVLMKPSEITPLAIEYAVKLMHEAGLNEHLVQVIIGDGSTGAALVDQVDYISFTGSTAVGRKIAVRAAERLIPCSLELGGKDPAIVLKDANLDLSAASVLRGAIENAGQVCMSIERTYVEAEIYDEFIQKIEDFTRDINLGTGDDIKVHVGSMTNEIEIKRTENHIKDAVEKGARVIYGGKRRPDLGPRFFEPTVLVDVDHSMLIMQEETFGPTLPIMKVKDAQEAVKLANDSKYGLAASIFSKDLKQAENLAKLIETGDVTINRTQMVIGTASTPSGGVKQSGLGRRNGPEGLLKYTSMQSIITDNNLGQTPNLSLLDPLTIKAFLILRKIRKYIPFI
ncbi:succinic semialdehyde dehydrogenase [Anaerolineales bacterium]